MRNFLPLLLIIVGLGCLLYSGWQLFFMNSQEKQALETAKQVVANHKANAQPKGRVQVRDGDVIGILHIPRLKRDLPIISGTDEDDLKRGVGHYKGTALPDEGDQILLSGHRDTVFRQMGEMEIGDELIVEMSYGTFHYNIIDTDIVDADDRTVIRSTAPDEILTLSTCYPFNYVGNASERFIIYAKRSS